MISKLLFDLDGTLTDPKEGICRSVQYALHAFGIEEPDIDKLEPFIGPPLMDSFMEFYGMSKERAAEAIDKYRERFSVTGWSENIVYEGVPHMLKSLRDAGYVLAVASSKPTVFVERILAHFGLRDAFSVVVGSELDGRRTSKDEVIGEALRQLFSEQGDEDLLMIGDRKFDVEGAHALGIRCVGVTYGYAQPGELTEAQADFLADSPDKLLELLLELRETDDASLCAVEEKCGGERETKGGTSHA
ncbi:MAG: HAD family hydrolase [Lachnospiraceae bacterium]|nr:HAD family hydrolase [Lachnospiraceae bacterium]